MARPIYQNKPIREGNNQGVGVMLPMNKSAHSQNTNLNALFGQGNTIGQAYSTGGVSGGSVFAVSYSTEQQAISNLKNLLLTTQGERFMQPKFGTRIREAVFQQNTINLEEFIKESLTEAIEYWLPYINLFGIDVRRNIDDHSVSIRLNFTIGVRGANVVIEILATENLITVVSEDITAPTGLVQVGQFGDEFAGGNY